MKDIALCGSCAIKNEHGQYFNGYSATITNKGFEHTPIFGDSAEDDHDYCYLEAMSISDELEKEFGIKTVIEY